MCKLIEESANKTEKSLSIYSTDIKNKLKYVQDAFKLAKEDQYKFM